MIEWYQRGGRGGGETSRNCELPCAQNGRVDRLDKGSFRSENERLAHKMCTNPRTVS